MKIALAQINVESGRCEQNFQNIEREVKKAKEENVDIIVFPEMCISGYLLQDQFLDTFFCDYVASFNDKVKALSQGIGIVFGNLVNLQIDDLVVGRDGRKARYNACLFAHNGEWVKKENDYLNGIHIKHLNPDYRFFDDSRYFLSGIEVSNHLFDRPDALISPFLFEHQDTFVRIALEVCEDIWSDDYGVDVTGQYSSLEIDFLINVSSSPYTLNKEKARHKQMLKHAKSLKDKMPIIIYVNACGMQNSGKNVVVFDGGSCVYDTSGNVCFSLNDSFQQEYKVYDFKSIDIAKECEHKVLEALTCALYEFDRQLFMFKPKWIIGLSGGIDSCITAALLVKALGKERVIGYNMASEYNSLQTKDNARKLAEMLGIEIREGSIEGLYKSTIDTMKMYQYNDEYPSLVHENIQARIRGHLLSTFASLENGVIMNNANKVEIAIGYSTLYGDSIGALSLIGDLNKVQLFDLAKELNAYFEKEVISETLIPLVEENKITWQMPPSAELKEKQVDPMKWYYHDLLIQKLLDYPSGQVETILEGYLDKSIYQEEIGKWIIYYGLDSDPKAFIVDLEWVIKRLRSAVFKRIQMPPIVVISRGAFGSDFRESQLDVIQTQHYLDLKSRILKQ